MADCPCISGCAFFHDKMANMPSIAENMKKRLCRGDNAGCARWMVRGKLGGPSVPTDLFPNQLDRAKKIIQDAGK